MRLIHLTTAIFCLLASRAHAQEDSSSSGRHFYFGGAANVYADSRLSMPFISTDGLTISNSVGPSFGIALEVAYLGEYQAGVSFGLAFDTTKKIQNSDDSPAEFQGNGGDTEFSLRVFYANLVYRWKSLYLPFGLNVSQLSVSRASVALSDVSTFPGGQVGLGYFLSEHLAVEADLRLIGIYAGYEGSFSSESRGGFLVEPVFSVKGYF